MNSFQLPNRYVIPVFNTLVALQSWLRPGLFAYIVGTHIDALRPAAIRLQTERAALLDVAAARYPETYAGGPQDGEPHPLAGQHVTRQEPGGVVTLFKSPDAAAEFARRDAALMDAETAVTVDVRLTVDDMRTLNTERLDAPRAVNGIPPTTEAVDFSALSLIIARPDPAPDAPPVPARAPARAPAAA